MNCRSIDAELVNNLFFFLKCFNMKITINRATRALQKTKKRHLPQGEPVLLLRFTDCINELSINYDRSIDISSHLHNCMQKL